MRDLNIRCQSYNSVNWCWAAASEALIRYYQNIAPLPLCSFVGRNLNRPDCCNNAGSPCDVASQLEAVADLRRFLAPRIDGRVTPDQIRRQILVGRPLCAFIQWPDAGAPGHFVLISGFSGTGTLLIVDPQTNPEESHLWDYEAFSNRYRDLGQWKATWLTLSA